VSAASRAAGFGYVPGLDGLRFIAIGLVFLEHLPKLRPLCGESGVCASLLPLHVLQTVGWLGVDVFLCLSAYLFTRLLQEEYVRRGAINLKFFYLRRLLRIYPLYFLMLGFGFFAAPAFGFGLPEHGSYADMLRHHLLPFLLFFGNVSYALYPETLSGLWASLWTINLEEHFYALFPLLAPALYRAAPGRRLLACAAALALAMAVRWYVVANELPRDLLWTLTFCRADPLVAGVLLGLAASSGRRPRPGLALPVLALAVPGLAYLYPYTADFHAVWLLPAVALLAASLTDAAAGGPFARCLALPPVRYLGRISYGLYVYHRPALATVHKLLGDPATPWEWLAFAGLSFALTTLAAALSYHLFERAFLRLKQRYTLVASRPA